MPQIQDDATARAVLDAYDVLNGGSIEIREGTSGSGTLIGTATLPADAMGAATGTGGPGNRTKPFLGEPYTLTVSNSSADDATELYAFYKNSGGTIIFGPDLVTTQADGTGAVLVSDTSGHASNSSKPVLTAGNDVSITSVAFTL